MHDYEKYNSPYISTKCIVCGSKIYHGDDCIKIIPGIYNGHDESEFYIHEQPVYICNCIQKKLEKLKHPIKFFSRTLITPDNVE